MGIRTQKVERQIKKTKFFEGFYLKRSFPFISKRSFPNFFNEMEIAHKFCKGNGIELGAAAHNSFNLAGSINLSPFSDHEGTIDHNDFLFYKDAQADVCGHYALVDVVGEADATGLPSHSQDYVISSHVVEHLPNLIAAFLEWNRILKPGGIVFMIFPKRNAAPADSRRPLTPLDHFIDDYNSKQTIHTHPILEGHGMRGHYHVFSLNSMLELIKWCNDNLSLGWKIEYTEETDSKVGNGHTVVARVSL